METVQKNKPTTPPTKKTIKQSVHFFPEITANIFYFEAGLTKTYGKYRDLDLSIFLGTEKILLKRPDLNCDDCNKSNYSVAEGVYLKPVLRYWNKDTVIHENGLTHKVGFYMDYKISLTKRFLDNQLTFGLCSTTVF